RTLVVIHQFRKSGGEYGEGFSGGHEFLGAVDMGIELRRDDKSTRRRRITTLGRLIESHELLYELRDDGKLYSLGDPRTLERGEVMRRVLGVMEVGEELSTASILAKLEEPKPSDESLRRALLKLAESGRFERTPPVSAGPA